MFFMLPNIKPSFYASQCHYKIREAPDTDVLLLSKKSGEYYFFLTLALIFV
jgi:hypothetical protein